MLHSLFLPDRNTWNFRDDLERSGISGARNESSGYYRFLKDVDVTDPDGRQRILSLVDILHKQAYPGPRPSWLSFVISQIIRKR